jgi:hypothetical protein
MFMHIFKGPSAHDDYFRSKTKVVVILAFLLVGNVMQLSGCLYMELSAMTTCLPASSHV